LAGFTNNGLLKYCEKLSPCPNVSVNETSRKKIKNIDLNMFIC
jgi:hypothetical protein